MRIADPTRTPLTNVPLTLLLSRISAPSGVSVKNAWWRDARTSWMTMSLSVERPIVTEFAGISCEPVRVSRAWNILVAIFPCSGGLVMFAGGIGWRGADLGGAGAKFGDDGGGPLTG
ncbi:hypothetical protein A5640_24285 [Mycobacterium asiaticum]|uniref:Uncharacterized protein n=1 Tax=Mycobacterium asiaticum TaxID=1790 RepID=A0A1A3L303_MYCAS|nr:hypothetical protein A5640_24285 [Mycobacterium asiaticum]